jgi:hypothetical protein
MKAGGTGSIAEFVAVPDCCNAEILYNKVKGKVQ